MLFEKFAKQAVASGRFAPLDQTYVMNKVRALVGDADVDDDQRPVVDQLVDLAVQRKKIDDGPTAREILSDQLYDLLTPTPAVVNATFWNKYVESPQTATNWFYQLCTTNNYVKASAIKRNIEFTKRVQDGNQLEITINLSKPEKDPKAIAAAAHAKGKKYPQCA